MKRRTLILSAVAGFFGGTLIRPGGEPVAPTPPAELEYGDCAIHGSQCGGWNQASESRSMPRDLRSHDGVLYVMAPRPIAVLSDRILYDTDALDFIRQYRQTRNLTPFFKAPGPLASTRAGGPARRVSNLG